MGNRTDEIAQRDRMIGRNIRILRGDRNQTVIGDGMRALGWPLWNQLMLSRVERGERPLRFTEAVDLATVLGVDVSSLLDDGAAQVELLKREHALALKRLADVERELQAVSA